MHHLQPTLSSSGRTAAMMVWCSLGLAACTAATGSATVATVEGLPSARQDADGWSIAVSTGGASEADLVLHVPFGEVTCDEGTEPTVEDIGTGQTVSYRRANDDLMESDPPGIDATDVTIDC